MTGVPVTELFLHGVGNGTNYFEQVYQKKAHSISRTCTAGFQPEVKTNKTNKSSFSLHLHHIQGLAPTSCVCAYVYVP